MLNFLASLVLDRLCVLKRRFHICFRADFNVENGWTKPMIFLKRYTSKKTPTILLNGSSQAVQKPCRETPIWSLAFGLGAVVVVQIQV